MFAELHTVTVRGQHRVVAIPELIIAAVAERHDISVLHYNRDFDVIAEITVEWVVPPGTPTERPRVAAV